MQGAKHGGFTFFELLIVIVIMAILASVASVMYGRVIERTRMMEADVIIGSAVMAQERYYVRNSHYTTHWHALDAVPAPVRTPQEHNDFSNGLENTVYYTNGGANKTDAPAGFAISFQTDANERWFAVAKRIGKGSYNYEIIRPLDADTSVCIPSEGNEKDSYICTDYMGLDDPSQLPVDPRVPQLPQE